MHTSTLAIYGYRKKSTNNTNSTDAQFVRYEISDNEYKHDHHHCIERKHKKKIFIKCVIVEHFFRNKRNPVIWLELQFLACFTLRGGTHPHTKSIQPSRANVDQLCPLSVQLLIIAIDYDILIRKLYIDRRTDFGIWTR